MRFGKILLVSAGHLSCDLNHGAMPAVLPYLATAHGLDFRTCGTLMLLHACVSSVIQPIFGLLADRVSRTWLIPAGILLAGCGVAAAGFADGVVGIGAAFLASGVGAALFHPEGARCANLVSRGHEGVGLSIFSVGGNAGFVVGPILVALAVGGVSVGGVTLGGFGLHGMALFAILGAVMAGLLLSRLTAWNLGASPAARGAASGGAVRENDWRAFGALSFVLMSRAILFASIINYLPLYWERVFGQTAQMGNAALAAYSVVGVTANLLGGAAADRWGFVRVIRVTAWIILPFMAIFPLMTSPWAALAVLMPVAAGVYAQFSSMIVLGQRCLPRNIGFASGITIGVAVSIGGVAAPILGWIADNFGGLDVAFRALAVMAALELAGSWFVRDPAAERA